MALAAQSKPSAFAELLRRSKFASYDPAIRQTYKAPPANAHRGDWGLKRPIALRRKNAFISLTSFEHHAHFAEWNHAENQVRFIRRVEEMGGRVATQSSTAWYKGLGKARNYSPFDSDFAIEEDSFVGPQKTSQEAASLEQEVQTESVDVENLGQRGQGSYGADRPLPPQEPQEVFVTHNTHAMSKREFKRYLRSLRSLRQEFQQFVDTQEQIPEKNLYALAKNQDILHYRRFLQAQMQKGYKNYEEQRIEPQPHPTAALSYRNPTRLESLLWTKTQPGFLLANQTDAHVTKYFASFGGIVANVPREELTNKTALLDPMSEEGIKLDKVEESVMQLRLAPEGLVLETPPVTVGHRPQGLKGVKLRASVTTDSERINWDNQHEYGSQEYVAQEPVGRKGELQSFITPHSRKVDQKSDDALSFLQNLAQAAKSNAL